MQIQSRREGASEEIISESTHPSPVMPATVPDQDNASERSAPSTVFTATLIGEIIDQELAEVDRIRIEELAAKGRLANLD